MGVTKAETKALLKTLEDISTGLIKVCEFLGEIKQELEQANEEMEDGYSN